MGHADEFSNFAQGIQLNPGEYDVRVEPTSGQPVSQKVKIEASKTSWLVAGLTGGIAGRTASPNPPADFTVIATDGSHIEVDRHQVARCFLLNISHVLLRYGHKPDAILESVPRLYAEQNELVIVPPGQGREQFIEGNLLGAKRSVEECRHLAEMAAALPTGSPTVALLDGTLMLWGLESYPDFVTEILLDKGLMREFDRLLTECLESNELAVIIARRPCILIAKQLKQYELQRCECDAAPAATTAISSASPARLRQLSHGRDNSTSTANHATAGTATR